MKISAIISNSSLNEAGSWKDIYAANRGTIADPNKIQIGQKINLPGGGTYTVQKGDTLSKIAGQQPVTAPQSGQGAKPSPTAAPVTAAVKGAENLTPYSKAADVAGVTGLAAAAGQFLPKVGGVIAKAVPGLNVAYQGADALRRASLGDYTGSAISAAGAVPILGLPAVATHAIRDKYRTGSFFPSDEELKTAVDKDKEVASATPKLKESDTPMDKKLQNRIKKLEEEKAQLIKTLEDKFGAGLAALRQMRGYGDDAAKLVKKSVTGDVPLSKNFGKLPADSKGNPVKDFNPYGNPGMGVKTTNTVAKDPAVWRKGQPAPAASTVAGGNKAATATAAAAGGKPLSRTATALAAAAGGGLIGYGLGSDDKGQGPLPTPDTTPTINPTPPRRTGVIPANKPAKDDPYDLQAVGTNTRPGPGSDQWLRSELGKTNKPTASPSTEPSQADIDAATKANTANAANVAADVNARLGAEKSRADFAKSAAAASPSSDPIGDVIKQKQSAMPSTSNSSDEKYPLRDKGLMGAEIKYRQDADGRKYTDPTPTAPAGYRQPETRYYSGDDVKGMFKEGSKKSKQNTVLESINTELNDILWLAGRQKR
jgi:LysM repeat protein